MSGCQAYMSCPHLLARYGCPEDGSGTAAVGCGTLATGGTGGGEIGWPASAAAGTFVGQFTTSDPSSGRKILRDALSPTENPPYRGNAISLFVGRPPCGLQRAPFQN